MKAKITYELTEETLEKDIDLFIKEAKIGRYAWDSKYGNKALKIIKQYFKILKEKFGYNEFEECKVCYEKLILFCVEESDCDRAEDLFGYEDLLDRINGDFDNFIKNYFICLIKTSNPEELAEKVARYVSCLGDFIFDADKEILLTKLNKEQLENLEARMLIKTNGMTKKDKGKQGIIYFLMNFAQIQKDKEKYLNLCKRFKGLLKKEDFEYLKTEYDEDIKLSKFSLMGDK